LYRSHKEYSEDLSEYSEDVTNCPEGCKSLNGYRYLIQIIPAMNDDHFFNNDEY
jgi:hypothetical protein